MSALRSVLTRGLAPLLLLAVGPAAGAQEETPPPPRLMFDLGAGMAGVSYGPELDAVLGLASLAGISRTTINLNIGLAWEVSSDIFVGGRVTGVGDRYTDGLNALQLTTYLYGASVMVYPFGSQVRVYLSAGPGALVLVTDLLEVGDAISGIGYAAGAAYDFSRNRAGGGLLLGFEGMAVSFDGDPVGTFSLYANYVRKRARQTR